MFGFGKKRPEYGDIRIVRRENGNGDSWFAIEYFSRGRRPYGPLTWGPHFVTMAGDVFDTLEEARTALDDYERRNTIKSTVVWPEGE